MVRCKMKVTEIQQVTSNYSGSPNLYGRVKLSAVAGEENKTWARYTPSGTVELSVDNPAAFAQFKIGETYFVDFTVAPATEAEEQKGAG